MFLWDDIILDGLWRGNRKMYQDETEILAADDKRNQACIAADGKALNALLADKLRYTHGSGKQEGKRDYIERLVSGKTVYESIQALDREVQFLEDAAIVHGRVIYSIKAQPANRRVETLFLAVWTVEDSAWKLLAWASTGLSRS